VETISVFAITMWLGMASEGEDSKERALNDHARVKGKATSLWMMDHSCDEEGSTCMESLH
jgi:hypothetical protein